MKPISLYTLSDEEAVRFAAEELQKYLGRATGASIVLERRETYAPNQPGLWLGTFAHFPGRLQAPASAHPFDDEIHIETGEQGGILAGANPRSVLLATYRYLTELGFRWVRPGPDGEHIPTLGDPFAHPITVHETPSYRHRGVCIEGAVSYEHVRDLVDWLPKLGYNAYFIQFREGYQFFLRWYQHEYNPLLPKQPFDLEKAREYTRAIRREIKRRGLILHMVGHGWTCEPWGVPGLGWFPHTDPLPESYRALLAEVNGKRDLWGGIPLNTNLCYGNPEARATLVKAVADYAAENPDVDILHLWLADGSNNHCECPLCRDTRPSDFYVRLCNEVDAELTRRNLPTRIVFLIYVDLLWPPEKERLANPDRFILMFAPITRTYTTSFTSATAQEPEMPPFQRNRLQFPRTVEGNLAFLRAWQRLFSGDSFDFDYHLMWDHYKDPGYYRSAQVLYEDIRGLCEIGLNGFNSCQVQRAFLPTGLMMTAMGRALWNRALPFDAIADDYYQAAFGPDWQCVKEYTAKLSELFDPPLLRGERQGAERQESARKLAQVPETVRAFLPIIEEHLHLTNVCQARSWYYLKEHAHLCLMLAPALEALARDDKEAAHAAGLRLVDFVRRQEARVHPVFDVAIFLRTIGRALGLTQEELAG